MTSPTDKTVPSLVERLTAAGWFEHGARSLFYEAQGGNPVDVQLDPLFAEAAALIQSLTEHSCQLQDSLHEAQQRNAELVGALAGMVRLSEMGLEASLLEPEENGNFAAYERAKAILKSAPQAGGEDHD